MCEYEIICPFKDRCKLWNTLSCETCGNNIGKGNYWRPRFPDPNPIITPTIPWTNPDGTDWRPIDDTKPWIVCSEITMTYSYKKPDN